MSADSPSATLLAAADRIRDLAANATGGTWDAADTRGVWSDEEKRVAVAETRDDARWIAALSPALAPMIEQVLRDTAKEYDVQARIFTPEGMAVKVKGRRFAGPLALAEAILGSGVETQ
jgi:hypothetical protein